MEPISVVVCNYQGAEHLPPCLEAIAAQTLTPDEVLVVDNASTDGSAELARLGRPGVRLIEMDENRGPCPARNRGLAEARNRLVLLVDNDAVLAPDALEKLAAAVRPGVALLQPRSVFAAEPDRVHYDGGALHYAGLFSLRNFGRPLAEAEGAGTVEVDGAVAVALLADRDVVLAAGGFDETFFILFEDLDLSFRLRLEGHTILSVEEALVRHRAGTAGISYRGDVEYPARRAFLHSRNRWLFLVKCYRPWTLLVAAPGLITYELAWAAFALRSGNVFSYLEGKLAFLRELPGTLARRRTVQARRARPDRELLVGGPLTVSPQLAGRSSALRLLDSLLSAWWRVVRSISA